VDMSVPEMVEQFKLYRHPRVPVFRVNRDNLVGFVHAEDVLRMVLSGEDLSAMSVEDFMHPPVVAPLTKKVDEMFDFFQAHNARAAVVLNEFGGVEGFVTMRDVLNFIFEETTGSMQGQEHYEERDENVYEVPGQMKLTDFNNLTNFGIEDPRMTTIGGVAFRLLDRLPKVGDEVTMEGLRMRVLEMDVHRIARIRVQRGRDELEEVAPAGTQAVAENGEEAAETGVSEGAQAVSDGERSIVNILKAEQQSSDVGESSRENPPARSTGG